MMTLPPDHEQMTHDLSDDHNIRQDINNQQSRATPRHRLHVLAELKKYRWIPLLSTYSGVVLDISESGLKVAFSGDVDVKPYSQYFVRIPLSPLGISTPRYFESSLEVKWFDQRSYRLGGLFINISENQKKVLAQILKSVNKSLLAKKPSPPLSA